MSTITHVHFYPADWLSGCHTLTAAERGVYITLIMMMYDRAAPLVEDHSRLARACGLPTTGFVKALDELVAAGKIDRGDGGLFNARVRREIENVMAKSQIAREKSNVRWAKTSTKTTTDECSGNAAAMLTSSHKPVTSSLRSDVPRNATETQSEDEPKSDKETPRQIEAWCRQWLVVQGADPGEIDDWFKVRKKKDGPITRTAIMAILPEAKKAGIAVRDAVRLSAENNWRGFRAEWLENMKSKEGPRNGYRN